MMTPRERPPSASLALPNDARAVVVVAVVVVVVVATILKEAASSAQKLLRIASVVEWAWRGCWEAVMARAAWNSRS